MCYVSHTGEIQEILFWNWFLTCLLILRKLKKGAKNNCISTFTVDFTTKSLCYCYNLSEPLFFQLQYFLYIVWKKTGTGNGSYYEYITTTAMRNELHVGYVTSNSGLLEGSFLPIPKPSNGHDSEPVPLNFHFHNLMYMQVILICLFRRHLVCLAMSRQTKQAFYWLLRKHS